MHVILSQSAQVVNGQNQRFSTPFVPRLRQSPALAQACSPFTFSQGFYRTAQDFDMALLAIIHAAIAGFMLFFAAVVPQAAFKTLSAKAVGAFLRVLFPRLFLFGLALSLVASGVALAAGAEWQLHVSLAVAAGFAANVFVLTPRINLYRDRDLDGDAAAKRIFGLLHLASVAIFLAQLASSLAIVGMFLYMLG